jgi:hypothetical protein
MDSSPAVTFLHGLLRSGVVLTDLLGGLVDECERARAFPEEDAGAVVLEMVTGTVAVRLRHVPEADLQRAAELLELVVDEILAELRTAAEISRRRSAGHRLSAS